MKHVIFSFALLALVSCKDTKKQEPVPTTEAVETAHEHAHEDVSTVYDNSWTQSIELDNGTKWQANAETNEGVQKMQNSITSQKINTLQEYHELANQLNEDKNYVVKNCTMEGPSHDNLHIWLLPLMEKIKALSEAETVEDASKLKHSIEENITKYNTYFQ